jgi:ribosomal protein L7/L12
VEGAPAVVKKGLKKEEAEALSALLQASGAKVTLL